MTLEVRATVVRGDFVLALDERFDDVVVLMGPNGSGKTTLLRAILGIERPSQGRIVLGAQVLFDHERRIDRPTEQRAIAYVPQSYALFPHLDALANVAFAVRERRAAHEVARQLLEDLGVAALHARRPAALSAGERQRVALARALAAQPRLLLLDEPLAALDPRARPEVRAFLREWLARHRMPAIVVTHDAADACGLHAPLCILEGGRVVQRGSLDAIEAGPHTEFAHALATSAR